MLSYVMGNKINILVITKSKLDELFQPFRLDCPRNVCVIPLYVKNNIAATLLTN